MTASGFILLSVVYICVDNNGSAAAAHFYFSSMMIYFTVNPYILLYVVVFFLWQGYPQEYICFRVIYDNKSGLLV